MKFLAKGSYNKEENCYNVQLEGFETVTKTDKIDNSTKQQIINDLVKNRDIADDEHKAIIDSLRVDNIDIVFTSCYVR